LISGWPIEYNWRRFQITQTITLVN
jgi:hypothetical protein